MYMNMKMVVCVHKFHLQTLIVKHHRTLHNCLIRPVIRAYRTKRIIPTTDSLSFTTCFLENKCGLSGKALINALKYVHFDSSDQRPHSVVEIFRKFGFPLSSITKIVNYRPRILQWYWEKTILPKLEFLHSISASQTQVVDIVTRNPRILHRSLDNHLKPLLEQLECVTGSYQSAVAVFNCNRCVLDVESSKASLLNVKLLVTLGVPNSQILKLLTMYGKVSGMPNDKFRIVVSKLMDMGFELSSSYFLLALQTLNFTNDSIWKSRCVLLKSFGFSDQEILYMFKKLPQIMRYGEKAITEKMEFFFNKLRWTKSRLLSNPGVLVYSLEKRTIPRCSVLQVLASKNSTSESYMLSSILNISVRNFTEKFVNAYKDEIPDVMEAYTGKLKFDEYTFKQKGQLRLKPA